ncbi:hypothetical protein LTR36_002256 [Oleoguttula mirabilis]|uniref:Glutathione S-transferase kappa n=1 Tax=Oleoguttula mirabilis TaxID=1507867 RepID=A0AAV9JLG2_9PEZI|nr:hypothetical protein LTR36_002256 [Oleoguttula mirabilis]
MARPKLTLFLDVISPFAYMAFYVTKNSPIFKQCDVTYIPIFLGGVMKACGNTPPIEIKNKGAWIALERNRWAKHFHIPMAAASPEPFPQLTLHTMRALCAVCLLCPDRLTDCFSALYEAFWIERATISKPDVFGPVLADVLGEALAKQVLEKAGSAEAKKLLSGNTELALEEGAFGLPWFAATNAQGEKAGFWGFDHLGQVVEHLGLERTGQGFRAMM